MRRVFALTLCLFVLPAIENGDEIRAGVSAGRAFDSLPLPASGFQIYMLGELHGIAENEEAGIAYLKRLFAKSGVRDVAIEEDAFYEPDAQAFVDGRSDKLPEDLCLRAGILRRIRDLNREQPNAHIRVHLTDVDSPANVIREHLLVLRKRLTPAASVAIPDAADLKERGLDAVAALWRFSMDSRTRSELRTVEHSIRAFQDGLEASTGRGKGSPYLEDREQAIFSNMEDLVRSEKIPGLLVLYGDDHVSRSMRNDGGPKRNQPFAPVALRLAKAGIKVVSIVTFPLAGRFSWRGQSSDILWSADDGHLASGETFTKILAASQGASFLYIEKARQPGVMIPSQDLSSYAVDAYLLFRTATSMPNRCEH